VEDEDVDQGTVHVERGVDCGGELADGGGEQVVGRVEDGELGEEGGTPGVLVRARTVVDIHAKVFGQELGSVAVAHDDALGVRLEEADDVDLKLFDQVAHAVLGRPHVVVEVKVNGPDTGGDETVVGMVRLVVIRGETAHVGEEEEEVQETEHTGMVAAMARGTGARAIRGLNSLTARPGLLRDEIENTGADGQHHGNHDPVGMFAHKRAAGHKGIGHDPDMEEHQEVVDHEAEAEGDSDVLLGGAANQGERDSHQIHG